MSQDHQVVPSLLDTTDCVLMSDSVDCRKPETYQEESLSCAEAPEWRLASKQQGDALFQRHVTRVVLDRSSRKFTRLIDFFPLPKGL